MTFKVNFLTISEENCLNFMGKLQHIDKELCETLQSIISSVQPVLPGLTEWLAYKFTSLVVIQSQ